MQTPLRLIAIWLLAAMIGGFCLATAAHAIGPPAPAGPAHATAAQDRDDDSEEFTLVPDPPCMLPFAILFNLILLVLFLALVFVCLVILVIALMAAAVIAAACVSLAAAVAVLALELAACLALLPFLAVIAISVAIGLWRRSVVVGFQAAFIQFGALAGLAIAAGGTWLVTWTLGLGEHAAWLALPAGGIGLMMGVGAALLFNFAWKSALDWVMNRWRRRRARNP